MKGFFLITFFFLTGLTLKRWSWSSWLSFIVTFTSKGLFRFSISLSSTDCESGNLVLKTYQSFFTLHKKWTALLKKRINGMNIGDKTWSIRTNSCKKLKKSSLDFTMCNKGSLKLRTTRNDISALKLKLSNRKRRSANFVWNLNPCR